MKQLMLRMFRLLQSREAWWRMYAELGPNSRVYEGARIANQRLTRGKIRIGSNTHIAGELMVFRGGGEIVIGDWTFVGSGTRIWSATRIVIGNHVQIAHNCNIFDSNIHSIDYRARREEFAKIVKIGVPSVHDGLRTAPVTIGDDAWLGADVTVLKGVAIGARAIVGAGSVVCHDVGEDQIVAGNPARRL